MTPKKVLFLTFWYPSEKDPVKGVFILEHARAIKAAGCEVFILAVRIEHGKSFISYKHETFTDSFGIQTHILSINSLLYKLLYINIPLLAKIVFRTFYKFIYPQFEPDIIHSNILSPCAITGHFLSKRLNKPHVITEHWSKTDKFFRLNIFSFLGKRAYNQASCITVVSNWLKRELEKHVSNPDKIKIVPNVIDSTFTLKKIKENHVIRFTAVATWVPPKNIDLIVAGLNEFAKSTDKPVELNIVGNGTLLNPVLTHQSQYPFTIIHHGFLKRSEISNILQRTHCFLHCSEIETFSVVIAEALCTGLPVAASNVGAIPELINESNGILCENSVEGWIEGIRRIMEKKYDNRAISQNAISKFHIHTIGRQFLEIYKDI